MWKTIQCPECESPKFSFLELEKACARLQCSNEKCKNVWWEHPWGKSCQHRKVSKADIANEVERLKKNNQLI